MAGLRSQEQERAAFAWEAVTAVERLPDYVSLAKSTPSLIMTNGLMPTLAYLQAKGHQELLSHLLVWLTRTCYRACQPEFQVLLRALYDSPSDSYMRATRETLELLRWLRQFSDARKKSL